MITVIKYFGGFVFGAFRSASNYILMFCSCWEDKETSQHGRRLCKGVETSLIIRQRQFQPAIAIKTEAGR